MSEHVMSCSNACQGIQDPEKTRGGGTQDVNPLVDPWLRVVHSTGAEISVTLLVSGRVVTGMLTPTQRWEAWEREVFRRTVMDEGGRFRFPSAKVEGPTPEMVEQIKAEWPQMEKELYDDRSEGQGFTIAYLRNATIHSAVQGTASLALPMLMVNVHSIAACSVGAFNEP